MKKNIPLNERIIVALDVADVGEAKNWVRKLDGEVKFFKVGLQLFLAGWWDIVDFITSRGNKVMLDLKFFDIPETVKLAVEQLENHGVTFATVHGNDPIIKAAVAAKKEVKILAVTVLTSFDESDMQEMGFTKEVKDLVYMRAEKALQLGCDGVVSSPLEASILRKDFGEDFFIVTPGIRPNTEQTKDDQKRTATPNEAIQNGADYIVIGRPITTSNNPLELISQIQKSLQ